MDVTPKEPRIVQNGQEICKILYWDVQEFGREVVVNHLGGVPPEKIMITPERVYYVIPGGPESGDKESPYVLELGDRSETVEMLGLSLHIHNEKPVRFGDHVLWFRAVAN